MSGPVPSPSMKGTIGWSGTSRRPVEDMVMGSPVVGSGKRGILSRVNVPEWRRAQGPSARMPSEIAGYHEHRLVEVRGRLSLLHVLGGGRVVVVVHRAWE